MASSRVHIKRRVDVGSLVELSMEPSENGWKVRMRDSTGPSLAGGGSEQLYTRHHGYWLGKVLTSWGE